MIESLQINHFRNHTGNRFEFGRFTLLAGPNGVGKSNVLSCLELVRTFSRPIHDPDLNSDKIDFFVVASDQSGNRFIIGDWHYRLENLEDYDLEWLPIEDEQVRVLKKDQSVPLSRLSRIFYFKPLISNLAAPHFSESEVPRLENSGLGMASVLAYLMTSAPDRFDLIQAALKRIVPQVIRIRAVREMVEVPELQTVTVKSREIAYSEKRKVPGDALVFDMKSASGLSARDVSDGTLVVLALLTALYQEPQPRLLLLDDIETGLHPAAQECLMDQLRKLLVQIPDLQIVATTHSPFIIDQCEPEEVWLLSPDKEGMCHAARMSDHPSAEAALKVLTTGEFWSAEGEDWVVAKKPTKKASVKVAEP